MRRLEALGFTTYEAKAYCALLQKYPVNGYELSKIAQIPPSKIYETLQKLKNRGAAIDSQSDPVLYLPVKPEVVFSRIKTATAKLVDAVIDDLADISPADAFDLTWNIAGNRNIAEKIKEIIARSRTEIYLSVWPEQVPDLRASLAHALTRDVRVIAATFGDCRLPAHQIVNLETCAANVALRAGAKLSTVVCDNSEIVISELADEGSKGIWTKTPALVLVAKEYIKHDIMVNLLANYVGLEAYRDLCQHNELLQYMRDNR